MVLPAREETFSDRIEPHLRPSSPAVADEFTEIAALAAVLCNAPMALIMLRKDHDYTVIATHGLAVTPELRSAGFCASTLAGEPDIFVLPDATADTRFQNTAPVRGAPGIRFYAGAKLIRGPGDVLGTICVLDCRARSLSPEQERGLRALSHQVVARAELGQMLSARQTETERLREALIRSETLESIINQSGFIAIHRSLAPGWPIEFISDNVSEFGLHPHDLVGRTSAEINFLHPDDRARITCERSEFETGTATSLTQRYRLVVPCQPLRWVDDVTRIVRPSCGGSPELHSVLHDVTAAVTRSQHLRLMDQALKACNNGIVIVDAQAPDHPVIQVNPGFERITGYQSHEIVGRNCRFLQGPDRDQPGLSDLRRALARNKACRVVLRNYRKDGTMFWNELDISPVHAADGTLTHFIGVQTDVTARRQAEDSLQRRDAIHKAASFAAETLLNAADHHRALPVALEQIGEATRADHVAIWRQTAADDGHRLLNLETIWGGDLPATSRNRFQNLPWETADGWSFADFLRDGRPVQSHRDTCAPQENALWHSLGADSFLCLPVFTGRGSFWGMMSLGFKNQSALWTPEEIDALLSTTRVLGAVILNRATATALQLSEHRFKTLSAVSPGGIFQTDASGRLSYINERFAQIFGLTDPTAPTLETCYARIHPADLPACQSAWENAVRDRHNFAAEFRVVHHAETRWVRAVATALNNAGGSDGFVGTLDDVTNYHIAANALRESETRYRSLVTNLKEVVFQTDDAGFWTLLNPAWQEVTGFTVEESLGSLFLNYVHPDDRERNNRLFLPLIERKKDHCRHEVRYLTKSGGYRWIEVFARLVVDNGDNITGTAGTLYDITERKLAEENLVKQRIAIEAAIDGVAILDSSGRYTYLNPMHLELFGYKEQRDLLGQSWSVLYSPDEARRIEDEAFPALIRDGKWRGAATARRIDGSTFSEEVSLTQIQDGGLVCVCRDITARLNAEETIRASLQEKEVMLKEIHHRVKNNMQIVSSLLNLQLGHLHDESARRLFIESQNRIASMALIHEKLYQSGDLSRIAFGEYLRDLTDNLLSAFGASARGISFELKISYVQLGIDTAIPCGLIVNEIVSNSFKHGFPNGGPGRIAIELDRAGDDQLRLVIRDNGRGIPADFDVRQTRSLGMQLVKTLVRQLRGTLEIVPGSGAAFVLTLREVSRK